MAIDCCFDSSVGRDDATASYGEEWLTRFNSVENYGFLTAEAKTTITIIKSDVAYDESLTNIDHFVHFL